jgi:hypothetical protein
MRASRAALLICGLAVLVSGAQAQASTKYLPRELALETNEKYGHDCFWAPPKGMDYADLPNAKPIQTPNLYPDVGSTYFVGQYILPAGAKLTFEGKYPRSRFMSYTIFKPVGGNQLGPGDHLYDFQIQPDPGSVNPFVARNRRDGKRRNYTLHVVHGEIPGTRARNTVYTESSDPTARVGMSIRNYLPNRGLDGTGGAGLPKLTLTLADGSEHTGQAACDMLDPIEDVSKSTFPADQWKSFVANSPDPVNAPASEKPRWERFWNALYSVAGIFTPDPAERESTFPPSDSGGFQSNPATRYMTSFVSLKYGKVFTVRGKMPTVPRTLPANPKWTPSKYQLRFWSLCSGSSPVTGLGFDCVYDQQVPVDRKGRYTIVVSKRADRPRNARDKCGYKWLWFGKGEEYPDPASRDYAGVLYMRFMLQSPGFDQAPQEIKKPGTEAKVMGPYFPRSAYTTKAEFEKRGCRS